MNHSLSWSTKDKQEMRDKTLNVISMIAGSYGAELEVFGHLLNFKFPEATSKDQMLDCVYKIEKTLRDMGYNTNNN